MAETTQNALAETTVVDTDVHLTVHPEELAPYLDEPHRTHISNTTYGTPFPSSGWDQWMGGKIEDNWSTFTTAEAIDEFCEEFHVDYPIINTFDPLGKFPQDELAMALMRGYNDYVLDRILDETDDVKALIALATQRPDRAAEEIDRLADEDGVVGAYIGTTGSQPPLGDPRYDVMYRAAEDNDLPIAYHGNAEDFMFEFPRQNQSLNKFLQVHTLAHTWSQELTLVSLLTEGVPEKFPDLNFVFLEAGLGWVPYTMYRLNKEYSIRRSEAPLLERSPEEYVRESCYFSTQPLGEPNDPEHMKNIIDMVGTDSIVYASDYPHWDFDHPSGVDKHLRSQFCAEQRRQVLHETPAEAFHLDA
ncbi:amidohydrolase [Halostella sp. JP-L12]|uniref:amidohydrolase family protein n=1 Tax=Halostella TaxID=1843185 RepID=UPI000EF76AF2|nr:MULTISPECIES: amidohydrolase family protein [Halostella]NHN48089.1 amidohydrolase [Halostella sp. JP-L12]